MASSKAVSLTNACDKVSYDVVSEGFRFVVLMLNSMLVSSAYDDVKVDY